MGKIRLHGAMPLLPVVSALILVILSLGRPSHVRAGDARLDGGGLPTRTRTPTRPSVPLPPTATQTPEEDSIFPATATMTLVPESIFEAQPVAPNAELARESSSSFSLLSCWPFAVVVLLVLIIGVFWISGRFRQNST